MDLIKLILSSQAGKLSKSTWKSILGVAVGVTLMLFITSKLDSFIINMEDYMLNFLPEIQFQRTRNAFPVSLKYSDSDTLNNIIEGDEEILVSGSAFWDRGIFQLKTKSKHINKDCLLFSGLSSDSGELLLSVERYLDVVKPIADILYDDSSSIIISKRLEGKLFNGASAVGEVIEVGLLKSETNKLTKLIVAGIYNNNSVNAIFLSRSSASKIIGKPKSKIDNSYIVRLKDKYLSKEWRRSLIDEKIALRDVTKLNLSKIDPDLDGYLHQKLDAEYQKAKADVDFLNPFMIRSWMDISPENLEYLKITRAIMLLVFSSIIMLTGLSIKFLFDTIIFEKKRQISILKILGYSNLSIVKSFAVSGMFIGAMGIAVGLFFWLPF